MFIAILDGHYIDHEKANSNDREERMDFLAWLLINFREECERIYIEVKKVIKIGRFFLFK